MPQDTQKSIRPVIPDPPDWTSQTGISQILSSTRNMKSLFTFLLTVYHSGVGYDAFAEAGILQPVVLFRPVSHPRQCKKSCIEANSPPYSQKGIPAPAVVDMGERGGECR